MPVFATLFAVLLAGFVLSGQLSPLIPALYLLASLVTFTVYAIDKRAARGGSWRTRESTLHLLSVVGGWPGALAAQRLLRHKTQKQPFRAIFLGSIAVNCGMLAGYLVKVMGRG